MKKYLRCIKPYRGALALNICSFIVSVFCELSLPICMARIMDVGMVNKDFSYILIVGVIMIALAFVAMITGITAQYGSARVAKGFAYELRKEMYKTIQEFSFTNIDHFENSSLVTRLVNDVNAMQIALMFITRVGVRAPIVITIASILMFVIDPLLAGIVLSLTLVLSIIIYLIIKVAIPKYKLMQKRIDSVNRIVEENVTGIRVVKSFVREEFEREKFSKVNYDLADTSEKAINITMKNMPIISFVLNITISLLILIGGYKIANKLGFTSGELMSFINYAVMILMTFNMLSAMIMNISRASASKERIDEILNEKIDIISGGDIDSVITKGAIEFEKVTFSYNNDLSKLALNNINFKINAGEVIGIIGTTGSGKSTIANLIPRLFDTTLGTIKIDGINVKEYSLSSLRESIGVVSQKNMLFSGTIKENLIWGKKDATDEEIKEAADIAQASEFIDGFSDGYQHLLNQAATNLSGGQKQRLCIARAILKKPRILILDDSTSAVDTATEARIRKSFDSKLETTTIIIVAQRIASVKNATNIIVLDNGELVGFGKHKELLTTCEVYREINESQNKAVGD